jgi:glycosyltransferase involved in cell wall biosynthesis
MKKIQVVILSRDRPQYLKQAIDSILAQTQNIFELTVSDNSEKEEVSWMISQNYKNSDFKLIRRSPPVSSKEHFQTVISELTAEYSILFHDDDIMHPNYIEVMGSNLPRDGVIAVGCNAFEFKNTKDLECKDKICNFTSLKRFDIKKDFLAQYLPTGNGIVPFPSYIYNTRFLKKISFPSLSAGKYSDVILLSSLLDYGNIVWLPNVLMYYRRHDSNDSNFHNIAALIGLFNYMNINGLKKSHDSMILFRFMLWFRWIIKQDVKNISLWRNKIVFRFLLFKLFYLIKKRIFWGVFFTRVRKRISR